MKRFLMISGVVVLCILLFDWLYFYTGVLYFPRAGQPEYWSKAEGTTLYLDAGEGFAPFEIRGVNMGFGKPGYYPAEHAITKKEYLRWFRQIQEMGGNMLRIYDLADEKFYEAFYEYNRGNPEPLYLLHGVWVDDYLINATYSALDEEFYRPFLDSCMEVVDTVHGRNKSGDFGGLFPEHYRWDISPWVYGYIPGVEWPAALVAYTDNSVAQQPQFEGTYFRTEDAGNFEILLAGIGEEMVSYETKKYGEQRVIAFSNWATTDPLTYPDALLEHFKKAAMLDVEHILPTEAFGPGQFASYHVYPHYPDYCSFLPEHEENTYLQYLTALNGHHTMPVVISEFGVPSSRGISGSEDGLGRNQGSMSETGQGQALISMYEDIMQAGSAGGLVATWQDEWYKRTWNTLAKVDLESTPYWSDYQTSSQSFGLLSFDPGEEHSVCYVDGDASEWPEEALVGERDGARLSMLYDEKFLYFLVEQEGFDIGGDTLYLPIDTTPNSGAAHADDFSVSMSGGADFLLELNGREGSRLWVQAYYDIVDALFYDQVSAQDIFSKTFPAKDSGSFLPVRMLEQRQLYYARSELVSSGSAGDVPLTIHEYDAENPFHYCVRKVFETGRLTYGNANPTAEDFNSLADFCAGDGLVEIKLPWQLLNFADPSKMNIHDDYYKHFGVEYLHIDEMHVGVGDGSREIVLWPFALEQLGRKPSYHERLKESYYILRDYWTTRK